MDAGGAQSLYLSQKFRRCVNRYVFVTWICVKCSSDRYRCVRHGEF